MGTVLRSLFASLVISTGALAESYTSYQAKRPDLFDPETGLRIARIRSPVPEDIPGDIHVVTAPQVVDLLAQGALPLDVLGARNTYIDPLTGEWIVSIDHSSLPGAVWIPELGRAKLSDQLAGYMGRALAEATAGQFDRALVVYCRADCWMSWNAAQRVRQMGYSQVHWFRNGTDGWLDHGGSLEPVSPVPDRPEF